MTTLIAAALFFLGTIAGIYLIVTDPRHEENKRGDL